ncbi:hypothetical protein RB601_008201 [Gaeumannomyces tritici]
MVGARSFIPALGALSLLASLAVANDVLARDGADSCQCTPENQRVRYIVVEMPEQPPLPVINAVPEQPEQPEPIMPETEHEGGNTTTNFGPCKAPNVDTSDPVHIIPTKKISLFYGEPEGSAAAPVHAPVAPVAPVASKGSSHPFSNSTSAGFNSTSAGVNGTSAGFSMTTPLQAPGGQINMTMTTGNTFVALEYIDAITKVTCGASKMTVEFSDKTAFQSAADKWAAAKDGLVLITNHNGACDTALERGFYDVSAVVADATSLSISGSAAAKKLEDVAGQLEMTFSSMPAAQLRRRLTLDPKVSLGWGARLPEKKVLFNYPPYVDITADSAHFDTKVTFSGYLKYNFWGFKLEDLYFDVDASLDTEVSLSANVQAAYKNTFMYAPDDLSWTVVNVPGIIELGPGVGFGIGVDLATSGAVGVKTQLGASMPAGNVHIDMKNKFKTTATGWNPKWKADAQISQKAEVRADVYARLKVQIAVKVLGGLIDLSSGLTAIPRVNNKFTLSGDQGLSSGGTLTRAGGAVTQPKAGAQVCEQGVGLKSDFLFELDGNLTKYWSGKLFNVTVPIVDKCWNWA